MVKSGTSYSGLISQINTELAGKQPTLTAGSGVQLSSDTLSLKVGGTGLYLSNDGYLVSRTGNGVEWVYFEYTVSSATSTVSFNLPQPCADINSLMILVGGKTAIPQDMISLSNGGLTVTITSADNFDTNTVLACRWTALTNLQPQLFLLSHQWSDYIVNDLSWLRADTFSWQNGNVYTAVYNHLVDDIDGLTPTESDTYGTITISYILAPDGHKICLPNQESNLTALFTQEGEAWYFLLDTTNHRFKLPRKSNGENHLYFFVGNYEDNGLSRSNNVDYVVESWKDTNSYDFYRVYKSGWVEQGGKLTASAGASTSTFLKPFATSIYNFQVSPGYSSTSGNDIGFSSTMTDTTFSIYSPTQVDVYWYACGQGA